MSNMSYCRFENTLRDLRDCAAALDENESETGDVFAGLSDEERRAAVQLVALCQTIAEIQV